MTIANVAISNTFNEFRVTTNEVISEVNKLSDGTATIVVDTSTANSFIGSGASLTSLNASSITTGTLDSARLSTSGVTANTYGSASQVPVLVIDQYGRVTSAANVNVAGVTDLQYHSANGQLQIDTADGGIFTANLDLVAFDTDDLAEGTANLYYTNERARLAVSNGVGLLYDSACGVFDLANTTVTAGAYGSASQVPVLEIDAQGRITSASNVNVAGVSSFQYHSANAQLQIDTADGGVFTANVDLVAFDTGDLAEGANLYYTDERARLAVSNGVGLLYDSTNGIFDLANTTVASGTYGSASQVPVLVVDAQGRVTSASNVNVAGVSSFQYHSANAQLQIDTADGGVFTANVDLVAFDTDDLAEGTANLYYTDDRARGAISVTDTGGDGSLTYDSANGIIQYTGPSAAEVRAHISSTDTGGDGSLIYHSSNGVIQYTGPSATEVRAHFSGGTGVGIADGVISIGQDVGTSSNVTFNKVTVSTTPSASTDLTNKAYVDEVAEGLRAKPAVEIATTGNLDATYDNGTLGVGAKLTANTNIAFPEIDGVTLSSTTPGQNGVLVKNQTISAHNGRYNLTTVGNGSTPWVLTRCGLCDEADEIPGAYVFVKQGTLYAGTGWVQTVDDPDTFVVGSNNILVTQFSGAGTYTAGTGLDLDGTQFFLANTAVTPATYGGPATVSQFTVDQQGRITAAANVTIAIASGAVSGLATSATTDTTNANNISSGTLDAARLATSGVSSGGYGAAASVPQIVVDNKGRITSAANVAIAISSGAVSGLATSATTDTTNATNISSGTLDAARLATSGVSAGGYGAAASVPQFVVDNKGRITSAANVAIAIASGAVSGLATSATTDTTNATNITSGTLDASRLATSGVAAGTYGSASSVSQVVIDNKGRVTSAANVAIAIASGAVSGLATSATTDTTNATNITSGTLDAARLATSGVSAGGYGAAASVPQFVVDNKGRVTSAANVAIAIASGAVSGLATSATTDTTNATNITSGTLANARTSAASANGASTIVARDASGNFAGNIITATTFSGSLDWSNVASKPDPVVTVTLSGDVTGSGNATLTDLGNGTISITTTIAANSVALGTDTTGNYMVDVSAGSGISISHTQSEGSTATISHSDTSTLNGAQGGSGIAGFTVDGFGHVTAVTTATYLTAEADTLATVTGRGATTTVESSFSGSSANSMLTANNSGAGASLRVVKELEFLSSNGTNTINVLMESTSSLGTLSFEGSTGQLFSVTDSMTGVIYSVNDVSGIPSIEVYDTGQIRLAEYSGRILVGTNTDFDSTSKLQVNGAVLANTIKFRGSTSGTTVLQASAAAGSTTITLPAANGTVITSADSGTVTSGMIADATIVNGDISASAAIAYSKLSLTGSIVNADIATGAAIAIAKLAASTISGVSLGNNLNTLTLSTSGTGLSGSTTYNGSGATTFTVASNATATNTGNAIVARDASGNFSAGTITATLSGSATTATNLAGGAQGSIPYQNASGTTLFLAAGTSGQVLRTNGTGAAPTWQNLATSATTDTTSATNITSGTLPGDRGVTAGSTSSSFVEYNGTTATSGQFDGGTTNPSATTRLNYGGYLYATRFYGDGSQLTGISAGATISDDNSTNATRYILWEDATSGTATTVGVSSSKLTFNPSTGTINATIFNSTSDERHKKNVSKITNATDLIKLLEGVEFEWVDNDKKSSGLIAQWVEKVLPHLVDETKLEDGTETKTLNYSGLIGYLIESVKELSDRIDILENKK